MVVAPPDSRIELFSTCPQSKGYEPQAYLRKVAEVARWSEAAACEGILVYTDNSLVDPWLVAQLIVQSTTSLSPLVAVQPVYMHPYSAAKMVASLAHLHGRRVYLNMVAGGFKNDLAALHDHTPHDERYDRVVEYSLVIKGVLTSEQAFHFKGRYYSVSKLKMTPAVPRELLPGILISGSSDAGLGAARAIGATAVKYPKPPGEEQEEVAAAPRGCRVGIIARESAGDAWAVAQERFPEDRTGQITHALAMRVSDSEWHRQLDGERLDPASPESLYWLGPFHNYKTFCPYLVGSYEAVGGLLRRYIGLGFRTFILDVPASEQELHHTRVAFGLATAEAAKP
jgi:alkanesulfonate monooxygenase